MAETCCFGWKTGARQRNGHFGCWAQAMKPSVTFLNAFVSGGHAVESTCWCCIVNKKVASKDLIAGCIGHVYREGRPRLRCQSMLEKGKSKASQPGSTDVPLDSFMKDSF